MAEVDLTGIAPASIATPAVGAGAFFFDSATRTHKMKDEAALVREYGQMSINNFSVAAQTPAAATRTYLAGSALAIPIGKLRIGTMFRWRFNMTKTAAGIAASTFDIAFGTLGTVGDTARVSFAKPAGTAVIDEGWVDIIATVRGPLSAAGIVVGQFIMSHNLAATGHAIIPLVVVNTISAGFDVTVANLIAGICLTSGAADAITIQMLQAEAINL